MKSGWTEGARGSSAEAMRLAVDVVETDDAFTFATDVPGVSREDVKVCGELCHLARDMLAQACRCLSACRSAWLALKAFLQLELVSAARA